VGGGSKSLLKFTVARSWGSFSSNPTAKFRDLAKNSGIFCFFVVMSYNLVLGTKRGSCYVISAE
jgi:hypothetical protein